VVFGTDGKRFLHKTRFESNRVFFVRENVKNTKTKNKKQNKKTGLTAAER